MSFAARLGQLDCTPRPSDRSTYVRTVVRHPAARPHRTPQRQRSIRIDHDNHHFRLARHSTDASFRQFGPNENPYERRPLSSTPLFPEA